MFLWVKTRLILLLMAAVFMSGCLMNSADLWAEGSGPAPHKVVIIEGCEYIEVKAGIADQSVYSLTHKGNCKNPIHYQKEEK